MSREQEIGKIKEYIDTVIRMPLNDFDHLVSMVILHFGIPDKEAKAIAWRIVQAGYHLPPEQTDKREAVRDIIADARRTAYADAEAHKPAYRIGNMDFEKAILSLFPPPELKMLSDEEIDALVPTKEELGQYLVEPDDAVAESLDAETKRWAAFIILYVNKVAQAQLKADGGK